MKHSHQLKIRSAAATLCAAVLLCACSYERIPDDGDSGDPDGEFTTVTLKVGPVADGQNLSTKGLTETQENDIKSLRILAFQSEETEPNTYKLTYKATGKEIAPSGGEGEPNSKSFSFTLRISLSERADTKLILIANNNPFPQVSTGQSYEEIQAALTSLDLGTAPAFADIGIPMFGFAGNSSTKPLKITEGMTLTAKLLRAVARVDVGVGTYGAEAGVWDKGSVNFDLTEIYVFKPQNKYTLIPLIDNLEYALGGTPSVTAPSPVGTPIDGHFDYVGAPAITDETYCKAEIYIPEVDFAGGTVYDANHDKRMALVIGGNYNGSHTSTYYRIDFTDQPTDTEGDVLVNVLRNKIYRFSITGVGQTGYTTAQAAYGGKPIPLSFTTEIVDWETGTTASPAPDMLVRMNIGGINGMIVQHETAASLTVSAKGPDFVTDNGVSRPPLDYNSLLGEAFDNTYNGSGNAGTYTDAGDALSREGVYKKLVIAPDNAGEKTQWKTGSTKKNRVLHAKKACWDYRGQGRSDWRLPRLSELYLIWLNSKAINQSKGFTSLGESGVEYWSASEVRVASGFAVQAYSVNASGRINKKAKTIGLSVRCVREIR